MSDSKPECIGCVAIEALTFPFSADDATGMVFIDTENCGAGDVPVLFCPTCGAGLDRERE